MKHMHLDRNMHFSCFYYLAGCVSGAVLENHINQVHSVSSSQSQGL